MTSLEQLLEVQERDSALDQLRHRRVTLPERTVLAAAEAVVTEFAGPTAAAQERRDVVARDVRRLEDEAEAVHAKVDEVQKAMYSGTITSPKELQAMQADVEQLQRHQRTLEDRELELMERQEEIDGELSGLQGRVGEAAAEIERSRRLLAEQEADIDGEIAAEQTERDRVAAAIPESLMAIYEECRTRTRGIGVARLVGNTCQGCRLTIPATEVARIRKAGVDDVAHCDNCGAILVATQ
jgi:predicted  nucleic acid-binding Zn-ribbon protein